MKIKKQFHANSDASNLDDVPIMSTKMLKTITKRIAIGAVVTIGVVVVSTLVLAGADKVLDLDNIKFNPKA